jgi:hypothetical protein
MNDNMQEMVSLTFYHLSTNFPYQGGIVECLSTYVHDVFPKMTGGQSSPRTVLHVLFYLKGKMFLPNGGNHSHSVIAPCPRRNESSATQLLQPQIQILAHYCFQLFEFPNDVLKMFNDLASIPVIR